MKNKTVLLSLDSLIGSSTIEGGAINYLEYLLRNQINFYIMYEQCSRNKAQVVEYLIKRGFPEISDEVLFASSDAATTWIMSKDNMYHRVAYLGGRGLKESIDIAHLQTDYSNPAVVIIGLDREVSYKDYNDMLQYILNGAKFISIDNRKVQTIEGLTMIGNGSIIKMLEEASDTKAFKFGKGNEMLIHQCLTHYNISREDVLFTSDNYYSDILPAMNLGLETIFITSGNSIEKYGFDNNYHPSRIADTYYGLIK